MAYSTTNPPQMISQRFGGGGPALWSFSSTDPVATVAGSSYFSNGDALGMGVADTVFVLDSNSSLGSIGWITIVTAGAGATFNSSFVTT